MDPTHDELRRLNDAMFRAENKDKVGDEPWDAFLRRVLSDDFRLRRANGYVMQNKWEMIEQVRSEDRTREGPEDVNVATIADYVIVTSVVTVAGDAVRYGNLKVFRRQAGMWQCVYWRVDKPAQQNKGT